MRTDPHREITQLRTDTDRRFKKVDQRFERMDKRFEQLRADMNQRLEQLYRAINTQTWKMIGGIGLIAVLGRLIERIRTLSGATWDRERNPMPVSIE
uniref:Uncharacterized protein n=1 Tax=Candidatus Kentrum sp. TC TaxID=2126339 RepID=A0A450ZB45_9GAMM|nr:MAG: hypothetical protein BECKTC1821E_GA0114239_10467 [Candidatus Kentron sp. TC]VFK51002.1 MAG: hypothetical protein BECKTC1821F_GA0114240_10017 [Candidatus Kentron sp. TC]